MTESPFVTTSRIINETSNSFDLLRIIAGELKGQDRESLLTAADELEVIQRAFVLASLDLIETRQRLIAVNDQLIEARRLPTNAPAPWSMSATLRVLPNDR
jgi:hypothetical protein